MKFQAQIIVTGMKPSKGDFEGRIYDSTKVYVQAELDEATGGKGFATQEYSLGTSAEFGKYSHLPFPVEGLATFEQVTTGKAMKTVMREFVPQSRKAS